MKSWAQTSQVITEPRWHKRGRKETWMKTWKLAAASAAAGAGLCAAGLWLGANKLFNEAIRRKQTSPDGGEDAADVRLRAALRAEGRAYLDSVPHEFWRMQSFDGLSLVAEYIPAAVPTPRTLLCIHGYTSTGRREFSPVARALREAGYNLILPDGRAHGQSEGEYVGFGATDQRDCLAWAYEAQRRIPRCQLALYGISMGAATVLLAGGSEALPACVRGIVEDCGYTSAADEFRHQVRTLAHVPPWPLLPLTNRVCRRKAGYDYREANALAAVRRIRVPVLFIHGEEDAFVPTWMGRALYEACAAPKQLWLVPGARHAMSYAVAHKEYVRRLCAFLAALPWRGAQA